MHNEIFEKVRRFVADSAGRSLQDVNSDTTLLGDLNIDGDDAWDFVAQFAKEFDVDLGDGLASAFSFGSGFALRSGGASPTTLEDRERSLMLLEEPKTGHSVTERMWSEGTNWLVRHLVEKPIRHSK